MKLAETDGLENDYDFFALLAFTGMRLGEAIVLKWSDIDFENSSISINKTYYNPNNNKQEYQIIAPKTASSHRVISIDPYLSNILKQQKLKQQKKIQAYNDIYDNQGFVFTCEEGHPYSRRRFASRLERLIKKMDGLNKSITPHSFRHTHATLQIVANTNIKVISQ